MTVKQILAEIDRRIVSIDKNKKLTRGGYYKVELGGQKKGLEYLKEWIEKSNAKSSNK
jgi:hypothetical protein